MENTAGATETAPELPGSTVGLLVESLEAYTTGKPHAISELAVFNHSGQLVGAVDLAATLDPQPVPVSQARRLVGMGTQLLATSAEMGSQARFLKVSYSDRELLVVPGDPYHIVVVVGALAN